MKFTATMEITLTDTQAKKLQKQAGITLEGMDLHTAMLMSSMTASYRTLRELLLTPDHKPMKAGAPTRISGVGAPIDVILTLTPDPKDNKLCTAKTRPPAKATGKAATTSPPTVRPTGKPSRSKSASRKAR